MNFLCSVIFESTIWCQYHIIISGNHFKKEHTAM